MPYRASAMRRAQEGTAEEEAAAAGENGGVLMDDDEKLKVAQRSARSHAALHGRSSCLWRAARGACCAPNSGHRAVPPPYTAG